MRKGSHLHSELPPEIKLDSFPLFATTVSISVLFKLHI